MEGLHRRYVAAACIGAALVFACEDPRRPEPDAGPRVQDPYAGGGTWYRANFHMHSSHSHGRLPAGELVELYRGQGYRILCITDHNLFGDQDGGRLSRYYQRDTLLHDWNGDGVVHGDSVFGSGVEAAVRDWTREGPPWMADRWFRPPAASIDDVPIVLSGFEASHAYFGAHFGLVGFPPGPVDPPRPGFEWLARSRDAGGFAYLAHPGLANGDAERVVAVLPLEGFDGIEIVNGARLTRAEVADARPLWDALLSRGVWLWGMANDDSHEVPGADELYPFTAFDMVLLREASDRGVLEALHAGSFYASTGLLFDLLQIEGRTLHVRAPEAEFVRFVGNAGTILQEEPGERGAYTIRGDEGYVRVEAVGGEIEAPRNVWRQAAWSQPYRVEPADRELRP